MYYALIIATILIWGTWAFLGKVAAQYNNSTIVTIGTNVGYFIFSLFLLIDGIRDANVFKKINYTIPAILPILLIGLLGVTAKWTFYSALEKGPSAPVIALTALYPIISLILACFFLNEEISFRQCISFCTITIGMVIFMWSKSEINI